jgi:SAM-dependent methyltransferase
LARVAALTHEQFAYDPRASCICGAALSERERVVEKQVAWGAVRFVRCATCGSWCQSPRISPGLLARWYDSQEYQGSRQRHGSAYVNYLADEPQRIREAHARCSNDLLPRLATRGARVLEIGCATGSVLAALREAGHVVHGIDLSRSFAEAALRFHNLDVKVGDILEPAFPENSFDVVLLFGTMSNLQDIPASVRRIRSLLKPGGTLIFNHPAADSLIARLYGTSHWMFMPSVNTFMTTKGCSEMLERAGFAIVEERTDRQMPSLQKLFNHAKLRGLLPLLERLGVSHAAVPFSFPVPGVRFVRAAAV